MIPDTEGARTGGTWLDPVYTPPAGQPVPYDPDTELGRRQIASTILHEYLKSVTVGVHAVRHEKPQADVEKVEQFIAMAHWATYVAANMGILTDNFETWVTLMTAGPQNASTVQEYFQSVHGLAEEHIPTQACSWVSATDQTEVVGLSEARDKSTAGTPATDTEATAWLVRRRDGRFDRRASRRRRLDKEPDILTTQAPAPYLGQFVDEDTEV